MTEIWIAKRLMIEDFGERYTDCSYHRSKEKAEGRAKGKPTPFCWSIERIDIEDD